jgi:flagellar biosynthesis component FlhA
LLLSPFVLTLQSIYSTPLSLLTPFPHLSFVILTLHLHIFATHLLHSITTVQCNNEMRWYAIQHARNSKPGHKVPSCSNDIL